MAFPAFFSPFFDAFGGMMKFVCEDDIFKTFTNTSPVFALNSAYQKRNRKSKIIFFFFYKPRQFLNKKTAPDKTAPKKPRPEEYRLEIFETVAHKTYQSCLDVEKEVKDSERAAPSVTERSFVITSRVSPSQPSVDSLDEAVSSESPV